METKDVNKKRLIKNDRVICVVSSTRIIPIATELFRKPFLLYKKKRKPIEIDDSDDSDTERIKMFNSSMVNCRLHKDEMPSTTRLQLRTGTERVLVIKNINGDHIQFWNDKDWARDESLQHYHPANRFRKVERKWT